MILYPCVCAKVVVCEQNSSYCYGISGHNSGHGRIIKTIYGLLVALHGTHIINLILSIKKTLLKVGYVVLIGNSKTYW